MTKSRVFAIACLFCRCAAGYAADATAGASEDAVQSVLAQHGVWSKVLRHKNELRDEPPPGSKGFPIALEGQPGIRVELDLDYWALMMRGKGNASAVYLLNPKDEQSALVISIGETGGEIPDESLAKEPGFTGFSRHAGAIGNEKITWRSWSDANHLYSDCSAQLSAVDGQGGKKYGILLQVTANTPERRKALEEYLESLRLVFRPGTGDKPAEPNGKGDRASPRRSP